VSLEFLQPDLAFNIANYTPVARSPMERAARAAGARFEIRDGWNVAVAYTSPEQEAEACRKTAGWADVSHLGKLELQATPGDLHAIVAACADGASLELGSAASAAGAWWCPMTERRALVLCVPSVLPALRERLAEASASCAEPASVFDVTTVFAAMVLIGPLAREIFARFCAVDLRAQITPVRGLRPGSIARQPGLVLREDNHRFLFLFGWAVAEYMWTVVQDAGSRLGARPIGVDALAPVQEPAQELPSRA
jgi:glycine cleavage system aminomethyltransferase T